MAACCAWRAASTIICGSLRTRSLPKAAVTSARRGSRKASSGHSASTRPRGRAFARPPPPPSGNGLVERLIRLMLYPAVAALYVLLVTQPHRKRVRLQFSKWWQDGRRRAFIKLKQFAQRQLVEKELTAGPLGPPSALTPKPGRQRDPAKKLAGWNLPEAEETRELVNALGRSGRPILLGPWLSEAGFEPLAWVPCLPC